MDGLLCRSVLFCSRIKGQECCNMNNIKNQRKRSAGIVTGILLLVCGVCVLCGGTADWVKITVLACAFIWLLAIPAICCGRVNTVLQSGSFAFFPFLYGLGRILGTAAVYTVGSPIAALVLLFLWGVYGIFRLLPGRLMHGAALSSLAACLLLAGINGILACLMGLPFWERWDWVVLGLLLGLAAAFDIIKNFRK